MLPRAYVAVRLIEWAHPAAGCAKFIGRVGALAVFLGVGTAIAVPVAHADSTDSGSPSPSSSSSSPSGPSSGSSASNPGTTNKTSASPSKNSAKPSVRSSVTAKTVKVTKPPKATTKSADDISATTVATGVQPSETAHAVSSGNPESPVVSPVSLTMLAYTRRQIGADVSKVAEVATNAGIGAATAQVSASSQPTLSNQVSPLGTQQQVTREQMAMQAVNTLPVTLMKWVLRQGFLAAANDQFALVGGPDKANLDALDNAVDEYALASAFSAQILNPMDPAVVTQVAPPHSWYGVEVSGSRLLYDNPDTIYRFIPVNKSSEYVITGRLYDGIPADTTFSVLEGSSGTTSTVLSLSDLDVSGDGSFVITVSGDPAAPGQTNHLQLTSSSTLVAARNTLGDWNTEDAMELAVHRVDGPPNSLFAQLGGFVLLGSLVNDNPPLASLVSLIPPLAIADSPIVHGALTALLMVVRGADQEAKYMALATTDGQTGELRAPNTMTQPASNAEFLANQLQSNGYFQIATDEALVLTVDPGNAGFFTVPVYNDWTITDDYWNEQTSLNNYQAIANQDGTYTLVISPTDPGVANWVSTGGLNQGIISMRFQNLDPESAATPSVQSQLVKLDELNNYLPAGTVYVTPDERTAQLALRKAGFDKRWAPYLQA
ncbi:hypothetical protein BH09ACT8_BH09ACT8_39020 [soil metagenome]